MVISLQILAIGYLLKMVTMTFWRSIDANSHHSVMPPIEIQLETIQIMNAGVS